MATLSDLASMFQTLADSIDSVDVDTATGAADDAASEAAALGAANLIAALEGVKDNAGRIMELLSQASTLAAETAGTLNGMT
ncbi:MAG TPA: hypothetical protein VHC49_01085 [Mycobacteriales bacterium]|nr:hypothetical protein [Mycobacteriales bacterium]